MIPKSTRSQYPILWTILRKYPNEVQPDLYTEFPIIIAIDFQKIKHTEKEG